ncbi:hypothetical protein ACWPMX_14115 [Tsuneonella sp. HG094]
MRALIATAALTALVTPSLTAAQDAEESAAEIEHTLRNPATQAAVAEGMAAASEALLDVPLAPLARAVKQAAGENPDEVDPDMTLRRASPESQDVPHKVRESLPRMMGAMGSMAGGMGAMMPALREMAERVRAAMDVAGSRY